MLLLFAQFFLRTRLFWEDDTRAGENPYGKSQLYFRNIQVQPGGPQIFSTNPF
ncbi:MAG: hypothetical protein AVDCRST_MAG56-4664 [uncultured Cytophagales bacterium]|uniref:Uncharacterized protein n=1 Tax=uncultured Cytophagales bacterium TaxID=158755 RepID=A0A6J4K0Q0_9SPHI|nr:MAG: hypothetical protein AVDCRST_MAG56-4664 [uncultured Cytophagales bacterium]